MASAQLAQTKYHGRTVLPVRAQRHIPTAVGSKANLLSSKSSLTSTLRPLRLSCRKSAGITRSGRLQTFAAQKKPQEAFPEQSNLVNEELLLYFFLQDLETRLQRALNLDRYEEAQAYRGKIAEVAEKTKASESAKAKFRQPASEISDSALVGLTLRSELQSAIEEEDYAAAAKIRDRLNEIESVVAEQQADAAVKAAQRFQFFIGQRVEHKEHGWRGAVCGFDHACCESPSWQEFAQIDELENGVDQPFYHVLVDGRDCYDAEFQGVGWQYQITLAYVPEERLLAMTKGQIPKGDDGLREEIEHPYTNLLFFGMDPQGNYIPTKRLREKYNIERRETQYDEEEEEEEQEEEQGGGKDLN
mmetsp:Transcript_10359/g.12117  ORF Transcript_10359/g.12117 Transcript_10359/m.12117 type:complete len:360 (+) Transcript_10359:213-1292(+)|eukprot:CAMPEP_0197844160 /NCGR_PEP_ID=MMETSP1438-20131217/1141_1 /TAXON_ID=1461541 /ORGANISM="Pterosperma sp., Strain CCMP1384" /LENGTH=359 /DNA_ID=CAMNT_0043454797 /DNA_START=213 /DNA_END=1292 /DNA_ORIENTATION=-